MFTALIVWYDPELHVHTQSARFPYGEQNIHPLDVGIVQAAHFVVDPIVDFETLPAGHDVHPAAPPVEYDPAGHRVQDRAPAAEKDPAGHGVHPEAPAAEYDPAVHCIHEVADSYLVSARNAVLTIAVCTEYVPALHTVQNTAP